MAKLTREKNKIVRVPPKKKGKRETSRGRVRDRVLLCCLLRMQDLSGMMKTMMSLFMVRIKMQCSSYGGREGMVGLPTCFRYGIC